MVCFHYKLTVTCHIMCFTVRRAWVVKMDWTELCGRGGIWLELSHGRGATPILTRQRNYDTKKEPSLSH